MGFWSDVLAGVKEDSAQRNADRERAYEVCPHLKNLGFGHKANLCAKMLSDQWLKIVMDCARIVNTTTNHAVFFKRYDLLEEKLICMVELEKHVKYRGEKPHDALSRIREQRAQETICFIQRAYKKLESDAKQLQSETAKRKRYEKFFDSLWGHDLSQEVETFLADLEKKSPYNPTVENGKNT